MDSLLNRYRNITVLLLVIFAQLVLLAYQVKGNQDVRLIRIWGVTAVTPLARVIESVRSGTMRTLQDYILFRDLKEENRQLQSDMGKLKLQVIELKNQLETADRVKALSGFQAQTASKMIPARVIGTGTGANARMIFVDQGSTAGVIRGMAVVTPDGIVGRVTASYPTASQVLLITDPGFAAGVISQKNRVHGTVHGLPQGGSCQVEYIQNEEKVEVGEMFFTSGDDRVFPKGFPVGVVTSVRPGQGTKQIVMRPTGITGGLEEVLIVIEGVHQPIPEYKAAAGEVHLLPPPPAEAAVSPDVRPPDDATGTVADRLREQYKRVGESQNHVFGEGLPGSRPPDFTRLNEAAQPAAGAAKPGAAAGGAGAVPAGAGSQPGVAKQAAPAAGQPRPAPAQPGVTKPPAAAPTVGTRAGPTSALPAGPGQRTPSAQPGLSKPAPPAGGTQPATVRTGQPAGTPRPKPSGDGEALARPRPAASQSGTAEGAASRLPGARPRVATGGENTTTDAGAAPRAGSTRNP